VAVFYFKIVELFYRVNWNAVLSASMDTTIDAMLYNANITSEDRHSGMGLYLIKYMGEWGVVLT